MPSQFDSDREAIQAADALIALLRTSHGPRVVAERLQLARDILSTKVLKVMSAAAAGERAVSELELAGAHLAREIEFTRRDLAGR